MRIENPEAQEGIVYRDGIGIPVTCYEQTIVYPKEIEIFTEPDITSKAIQVKINNLAEIQAVSSLRVDGFLGVWFKLKDEEGVKAGFYQQPRLTKQKEVDLPVDRK